MTESPRLRRGAEDPRDAAPAAARVGERAAARTGASAVPDVPGRAPTRRALRGGEEAAERHPRRATLRARSFIGTLKALDRVAAAGGIVSVRVVDLDTGDEVLAGDDHLTLPVAGLGVVPLLVEAAAQIEFGQLDPAEVIERRSVDPVGVAGLWQHLAAAALPAQDLAVLAAAASDASAANALLARVGLDAVRSRLEAIGLTKTALLDGFRDVRGPDDAPQVALSSARELSSLFAGIVNAGIVSPAVSAQVGEWLNLNQDLGLVGAATALDPFAHEQDRHGLLFVNKTGRADGIRAEAGVLAGPRRGVAYALIVCFDDLSIAHRLRAHETFHALGLDLMEHVS